MTLHKQFFWLWMLLLLPTPAQAENSITIATAVNFITPMTELTSTFTNQYNVKTEISYGSSGKLYAQMQYGAPYDIFLSADRKRPQLLYDQGICEPPFKYAAGAIVLWSKKPITTPSWQTALQNNTGKVALPSPEAAPYGEKAYKALVNQNLLKQIKPQLIYGQSVGQTFLFTSTGGATLGFVALSQAISDIGMKGSYLPVPEAEPVEQWGCLAVKSKRAEIAQEFIDFLLSEDGMTIYKKYGYE